MKSKLAIVFSVGYFYNRNWFDWSYIGLPLINSDKINIVATYKIVLYIEILCPQYTITVHIYLYSTGIFISMSFIKFMHIICKNEQNTFKITKQKLFSLT